MVQCLTLRTSYWITAWLVVIGASESCLHKPPATERKKKRRFVRPGKIT